MSFYMVGSDDKSVTRLLRSWWYGGKKDRVIEEDNKICMLPHSCYVYKVTPQMGVLLQWLKMRKKGRLRVYEIRELDVNTIRDVPGSSSEAHPSSEEEP